MYRSVFLTWLRIAYADFRDDLIATIDELKQQYLTEEDRTIRNPKKPSLAKAYFIHVVNLYTLFEDAIPTIQDYGIAIKLHSADSFFLAFKKLFRLFLMLELSQVSWR